MILISDKNLSFGCNIKKYENFGGDIPVTPGITSKTVVWNIIVLCLLDLKSNGRKYCSCCGFSLNNNIS